MKNIIQSQKNWKDFKTNGRVGVISTLLTEQFLKGSFELFNITPDNYKEEIELNAIDTVFIDNDLYEADHSWYRKNRGHIINYLKNENKNICLVKNTSTEVAQIFKQAFVLEIVPSRSSFGFSGLVLEVPIQINTDIYNPINSKEDVDITYFKIGQHTENFDKKKFNLNKDTVSSFISSNKLNRRSIEELLKRMKYSRVTYIYNSNQLDEITLKILKKIGSLNSTYTVLDHKFNFFNSEENIFRIVNNKLSILLKNPQYTFKQVLSKQRKVLIQNTCLLKNSLNGFLKNYKNEIHTPKISVITSTNRKENLDSYFSQLDAQENVDLEINVVTHGFQLSNDEKNEFKKNCSFTINFMFAKSSENLGACLNKCVELSTYPTIAKIDDDDFYLNNYLIDQWLSLEYSNADITGKSESYYYFETDQIIALRNKNAHLKYGDFIMGATIMIKTELMRELLFANIPKAVDTNLLRRAINNGNSIYCNHPYEMCVFRSKDNVSHTWQVDDLAMLKSAEIVGYGNPIPYVRLY